MMNVVTLIGNLGADPKIRYSQSGQPWGNVNIAVTEKYTDNAGNKQSKTHWFRIVFFGKTADIFAQYTKKGSRVGITGKLVTRQWEDQTSGQKRSVVEIKVDTLELLGTSEPNGNQQGQYHDSQSGQEASRQGRPPQNTSPQDRTAGSSTLDSDDPIPF
jgi:single-strand DNA-binding protein